MPDKERAALVAAYKQAKLVEREAEEAHSRAVEDFLAAARELAAYDNRRKS